MRISDWSSDVCSSDLEFPPGRLDDAGARDRATTKWGAFLDGVDRFDAAFFHISPREAASMDPQQRILLETAWRALENAGQAPDRLAGSASGVFMGLCNYDYAQIASGGGRIDAWSGTGRAPGIVAGRLASVLGLEGPAMVVDPACSSSSSEERQVGKVCVWTCRSRGWRCKYKNKINMT